MIITLRNFLQAVRSLPNAVERKSEGKRQTEKQWEHFFTSVSRGSWVAFILPSAFTGLVSKSQAFFFLPFPASAEVSSERSRRKEEASITFLYVRSLGRLMQPEIEQKDNPISQLRFNPVTFPWFRYFRTEKCRELQKGAFGKKRKKKRKRGKQKLHTAWVDTFGMDAGKCGQLKHNVCWDGK